MHFLGQSLALSLILAISTLSRMGESVCSDHPRLFLHQKTSVRELLESDSFVTLTDISREFLTCRGSQNVDWIYEGNGEPSKIQESSSIQIKTDHENDTSYCMTSRISIYPKQSDTDLAKHTGKAKRSSFSAKQEDNYSSTWSGKCDRFIISDPLRYIKSFREFVSLPKTDWVPKLQLISTSTSGSHSALDSASMNRTGSGENSTEEEQVIFDPRFGFRVSLTSPQQNLSSFYGDYKCVAKIAPGSMGKTNENGNEDFVIFGMVPPSTFRAFPPESTVFTSNILNLTCQSSEDSVILKQVKVRPLSPGYDDAYNMYDEEDETDVNSNSVEDIDETLERTENKLHVANYLDLNPVPGTFGEFQCLAEKDKRVLHSWRYRVLGKKEDKLSGIKFNKLEGSFSCRSKSGLPGRLSFVSCRTPSECRINEICLQKSDGCRGYSNATKALCHRGNNFCGKIFYKGGSGLIRCIGDGIDQIRGFTDEANDLRLRMGFHKLKASETVLLSLNPLPEELPGRQSLDLVEGEEVNLSLNLGYYYFLQPVQWAVKFSNGSTLHIAPEKEDLHKTKLHRTIHARIRLPVVTPSENFTSSIVGINALIPLRSSVLPSWKTITLLTTVKPVPSNESASDVPQEGESQDLIILGQEEIDGEGRTDIQFDTEIQETTQKIMEDVVETIDQSLQNDDHTITTNNNKSPEGESSLMTVAVKDDVMTVGVTDPSFPGNSQEDFRSGDSVTTEREHW
ncbi:hypothetical protein Fcan01_14900 [Folsomia candida]|uniref:Uncharacterized protein n=1 Tax=Folsomia candida TaxID=158441 RepID=A0A226DZZ9_FOLCA|nr:hypothetical protein Fcan01_14900 [Folsomia candida]